MSHVDLARDVRTLLRQGDHLCMVYDDPGAWLGAVVPFLQEGLQRGERCVYIAHDDSAEQVAPALAAAGVDVHRERERGALAVVSPADTYFRTGAFQPQGMIAFMRETIDRAMADGCSGWRVAGEPLWALGHEPGAERLIEYEALLNDFFPSSRSLGFCQYDRRRFPPALIRDVLRTHPTVIVNELVCRTNLYFERADLILEQRSAAERVEWMIGRLGEARCAEQQLQDAREEAERANRAKDESLATLSHELRTPLNAILGWARLLAGGVDDPASMRRGLETVERNARAQAQLVSDLLDVSRITTGTLRLDTYQVDLAPIVSGVVETVRPAVQGRRLHLDTVGFDGTSLPVVGDPDRLQQVAWNLLSNAIKYTPPGGRVRVALERRGGDVVLAVSDTGQGIAADFLPHVFDRFRQADSSTTRRVGGMGLGLAIARQLVELHGGTIHAASDGPGCGAVFSVTLPLAVDTAPLARPGPRTAVPPAA